MQMNKTLKRHEFNARIKEIANKFKKKVKMAHMNMNKGIIRISWKQIVVK